MAPPETAADVLELEVAADEEADDGGRCGPGDEVTLLLLHSPRKPPN